ncbi:hypothetical protein D3Y57_13300 [Sphingomonas paeninsulae]|uniref:Uncharacterized protein n=1 Tax=Sphingomonas paeninsulae TaxID=2319844 RepID=A0A494TBE2_SPHPE|nr:hypothetical protein [Sphingomonas paeninsulae]AYJ86759.1 hypothetical protein D3Y57_13300 [Sphingomonas paeninsulae]
MSDVSGKWDCVTKSPLGELKTVLTVVVDGNTFTGSNSGAQGSMDITDGKVDGNTLTWTMDMKVPMPMVLECNATIDGETLTGGVKAGAFGTSPMSGTRAA